MQMMIDGYYRDSYNDECEEEVEVTENSVVVKYGELVTMSVRGYQKGEIMTILKESVNEQITVLYDEQQIESSLGKRVVLRVFIHRY